MRKPDFFIIGAPRSGTTSMQRLLWDHPDVFIAGWNPHFFGTDLYRKGYIRDEQAYLSLFAKGRNEKRLGERSTRYLMSTRAAVEIKEFQPSASIIIMLRNPVDVIYSLHGYHVHTTGHEDILDLEEALEAEEDRRCGHRLSENISPNENWLLLYRDAVRYAQQIRRYLDVFRREQVHVIVFDDFIRDTAGVYRNTLRFLKVTTGFQPDFQKANVHMRVHIKTLHNFLIYPPKFLRSLAQPVIRFSWARSLLWALASVNSRYSPREPLPPELKIQLQTEFFQEVVQLSQLLNRDLTHWCKPDRATTSSGVSEW
jgi:hypothetical protein